MCCDIEFQPRTGAVEQSLTCFNPRDAGGVKHPLHLCGAHRNGPQSPQLRRREWKWNRQYELRYTDLEKHKGSVFILRLERRCRVVLHWVGCSLIWWLGVLRRAGRHYRCMFTTFQLAPVLQHGVNHIPRPRSLSVCWGHVQEVLHTNTSTTKRKQTNHVNTKSHRIFLICLVKKCFYV